MIARIALGVFLLATVGSARVVSASSPTHRGASRPATLQARIDAASPGSTLKIPHGTYIGDLVLRKPLRLVGIGRPLLVAGGAGTVVQIRAADVTIDGFDIDGKAKGDLGDDSSGIHIAAPRATIRNCRIRDTLFGIYLREAHGAVVDRCTIRGIPGKEPGEKGSGIHVWNTNGYRLTNNDVTLVRDGFYIQSSSNGMVKGNVARDLRYGLHYMYSDDNAFEDNLFANGAAGAALMYSRRITFRRNRFVHNRGFASVGLLLKACDDVIAEDNLIADNARGIFLEGSYRNVIRRNVIASSDTALVLYDSCAENRIEDNSFLANLTPLTFIGRRTDTIFRGNYWSDNREPDLDGDGLSDRPYRIGSVFDHFRGNVSAADLFGGTFATVALEAAETMLPILDVIPVEDSAPLVRPPQRPGVPMMQASARRVDVAGILSSLCLASFGSAILIAGRRKGVRA